MTMPALPDAAPFIWPQIPRGEPAPWGRPGGSAPLSVLSTEQKV